MGCPKFLKPAQYVHLWGWVELILESNNLTPPPHGENEFDSNVDFIFR